MYDVNRKIEIIFSCDGEEHRISGAEEWACYERNEVDMRYVNGSNIEVRNTVKSIRNEFVKDLKQQGWKFFQIGGAYKCWCPMCNYHEGKPWPEEKTMFMLFG